MAAQAYVYNAADFQAGSRVKGFADIPSVGLFIMYGGVEDIDAYLGAKAHRLGKGWRCRKAEGSQQHS